MKPTDSQPASEAVRCDDLLGGLVADIRVCHLPYQDGPYVCGTIKDPSSPTGLSNVWLRADGKWNRWAEDPRNTLKVGGWNPPNDKLTHEAGGEKL